VSGEVTITEEERLFLIECLKCAAVMQGSSSQFHKDLFHKLNAPDRRKEYEELKKEFS
jgi:hypothetical protein